MGGRGWMAQSVEQLTLNQRVPGSSPGAPTTQLIENFTSFRIVRLRQAYSAPKRFQRGSKCASPAVGIRNRLITKPFDLFSEMQHTALEIADHRIIG
jgi:hypothetical protein